MSSPLPVIALLCSSGGLDAVTRVLAPLPADLPAAVLVVQHLQPERASELPTILAARTALTVTPAVDGDLLTAGRVLVAPAGQHTLIHGQRIALIASGAVPPYRPSADLLLTTLAIAAGPRVIAVVLSGKGNDAATGATAVHRFGGTVIACSTETSTQPAMPQARHGPHRRHRPGRSPRRPRRAPHHPGHRIAAEPEPGRRPTIGYRTGHASSNREGTTPVNINTRPNGGGVTHLAVTGELDMATTDELAKAISHAAAPLDTTRVIVDLANVTFCDSTGIAVLVRAQAEAAEHHTVVQIANPQRAVRRVLEVTCVLDALTNPPPA
jgi:two-component system chemotaxis response regulator CheB